MHERMEMSRDQAQWQLVVDILTELFPDVSGKPLLPTLYWLLTYLRTLDDCGVLPAWTDHGILMRRVGEQWRVNQQMWYGNTERNTPPG